jgi:dihydrofolate reductase
MMETKPKKLDDIRTQAISVRDHYEKTVFRGRRDQQRTICIRRIEFLLASHGVDAEDLKRAADRYAQDTEDASMVMGANTFYGPHDHWDVFLKDWEPPPPKPEEPVFVRNYNPPAPEPQGRECTQEEVADWKKQYEEMIQTKDSAADATTLGGGTDEK